jgi:hypothetical protein
MIHWEQVERRCLTPAKDNYRNAAYIYIYIYIQVNILAIPHRVFTFFVPLPLLVLLGRTQ